MGRTKTTVLACLLTALAAGAAAAPLTFEEAVAMALENNEDYLALVTQEGQAAHLVGLARSAVLPRLELSGVYTRYKDAVEFEFTEGETFTLRPKEDWNAQATLTQPLFQGMREWNAIKGARVLYRAARADLRGGVQDVALAVGAAFTDCQTAAAEREVRAHGLDLAEAQEQVATSLANAGEVTDLDVQRARAQVLAARVELVRATAAETLAYRRLARLLGLDDDARPELGPLPAALPAEASIDGLREAARRNRPELRAAADRERAAELTIKVEKGNWLPDLDLTAQYYRQQALFPSQDWVSGSLNLTVPIYDGGATAARVADARAKHRLAVLDRSRTDKRIAEEIDTAWTDHAIAEATLDMVRAQHEAATEAYRQTDIRYREGEATATDLLSAQDALVSAELDYARARYRLDLTAAVLARAAGIALVTSPIEEDEE